MLSRNLESLSAWLEYARDHNMPVSDDNLQKVCTILADCTEKAHQLESTCVAQAVRLVDPLGPNVIRMPERRHGG
ncbi:hypothetical protein AFEL58S_01972 [Afipia felis]